MGCEAVTDLNLDWQSCSRKHRGTPPPSDLNTREHEDTIFVDIRYVHSCCSRQHSQQSLEPFYAFSTITIVPARIPLLSGWEVKTCHKCQCLYETAHSFLSPSRPGSYDRIEWTLTAKHKLLRLAVE